MGFASYDALITALTAGQRLPLLWQKNPTTAPVAGVWYHMWPVGGMPGAGALYTGTALNFQRTNDASAGALYHGGNVSALTKHIVSLMAMASAGSPPPIIYVVDQVGYYPLTQSASSQVFVNTNAPDRYVAAGEPGLLVSLVNGAAGGATASNLTVLTYVNQAGTAGQVMPTGTAVAVTVSTALPTATLGARVLTTVGAGPFLPLAAGDTGVRSLTNVTFSAANTGLEAFVLCRPLAFIPCPSANVPAERDLVMQLAALPRVYDGACIAFIVFFPAATGATLNGQVDVAWG